ncbi:MAG: Imm52 family immunity protein [Beijerinckiaceae bacterium]|nr:Imm52 family immunity protein [Beijerinckiaceae bacterium]
MLIPIPEQQTLGAYWNIRRDTPSRIAARYLAFLDRIEPLHPAFSNWILGGTDEPEDFNALRHDFVSAVEARVSTNDDGEPEPSSGYDFFLLNSMKDSPSSVDILGAMGAKFSSGHIVFQSSWVEKPDPSIVDHTVWKKVFIALIECFDAEFGRAWPSSMVDVPQAPGVFDLAWMTYIPPDIAPKVAPPASAIVDRLAGGGMILSATDEIFDTGNPRHFAGARDILAALMPVQKPDLHELYQYDWSKLK